MLHGTPSDTAAVRTVTSCLTVALKVQPSPSAADGADSERVAGLLQEYLETILTLYLYFLVILIGLFIVILKYTLYYINLCCSLSLKK